MKTENFTQLIRAITGRDFEIHRRITWPDSVPAQGEIETETVYAIVRTLPLTERVCAFDWKTPKSEDKLLRSFITAFTSKYREPDPETYRATPYGGRAWASKTPKERESAYGHHSAHMLSKEKLLAQVVERFNCSTIETAINRWGFYETEYGIGIFCFMGGQYVLNAINRMREFLISKGVSASEEFSDARWVYRFRIEATLDLHIGLLRQFCSTV